MSRLAACSTASTGHFGALVTTPTQLHFLLHLGVYLILGLNVLFFSYMHAFPLSETFFLRSATFA